MDNPQKINDTTFTAEQTTPEVVIPATVIPAKTEIVVYDVNVLATQEEQIKRDYAQALAEATSAISNAVATLQKRSAEVSDIQNLLATAASLGIFPTSTSTISEVKEDVNS